MIGFEFTHNGTTKLIAGGANLVHLSAVIAAYGKFGEMPANSAEPFGMLSAIGHSETSAKKPGQMLTWNQEVSLKVGDEIMIRLVELSEASEPNTVVDLPESSNSDDEV